MDATLKTQAEKLARDIATQVTSLDGLTALMRTMMQTALEQMLDTEMDVHLGRRTLPGVLGSDRADSNTTLTSNPADKTPKNRRNGHSRKTVSGEMGDLHLQTPRDRNGSFEPQLIPKYQRRLAGFDDKILALYA